MQEKPLDAHFARRFAECLRDTGMDRMNQTELGAALRVSQGMAGRYLRGADKPKGQKLEEITLLPWRG